MSLESFKTFVKESPNLADFVTKGERSWQDFYNMFNLYGANNSVWDKYLGKTVATTAVAGSTFSFKEFFNMFKNMDMREVQSGIGSIQKGLGYLQDVVNTKIEDVATTTRAPYEPRPMHKHFDD